MKKYIFLTALCAILAANTGITDACSRVVYLGPNNTVLTGRNMDWKADMGTHLWILPRGIQRNGAIGKTPFSWKTKYGSVVASTFDAGTPDGMNEKGLVANMLWLQESEFPKWDGKTNAIAISAWGQYMLDNFATVAEAVAAMNANPFEIVTAEMPGGSDMANMHLALSDASGDSAIFEYTDGKLTIYHSRDYQVVTNSPVYPEQLANANYWETVGGTNFLPGTNRASDRFARGAFYINHVLMTDDARAATGTVFSVIRNLSVPYGINTEGAPNISSTRWRVVADQKNLLYHYEDVMSPNVFYVDLKEVDFSANAGVRKLDLTDCFNYQGNVTAQFAAAKPFQFLGFDKPQI